MDYLTDKTSTEWVLHNYNKQSQELKCLQLRKLYGFSQNYVNLQELAAYYTDISEKDAANPINQWWMVPLYH